MAMTKTAGLYHFRFWRSSLHKISITNQDGRHDGHVGCPIKKMKKNSGGIFMGYRLVKFEVDPISIKGDMGRDGQTDGQTQGDSNSSAGL